MAELNANLASGDVYSTLLDKLTNPGSGVVMSSLVADANSMLQSKTLQQRNGNLPLSPVSFLSDNLSNSAMDGSRVPQNYVDENSQQGHKIQQLLRSGVSTPLIESKRRNNQFSLAIGTKQDSNTLMQMLKKPRIDGNHDTTQDQIVQQLLLRQDTKQLQDRDPQLRALIQHHRQQIFDSLPQIRGVQAQQSEQQFRHDLQQQATCPASSKDDGVCSQRLMQFLYNLKNRPQDNSIDFWRKIVSEFYAPSAKERWCLSSYQNIGKHALGTLPLGAVGAWCCDLCGSRSGMGFEASFEVLARLWKIKFMSGVLEEILFLGFPREHRSPCGVMLLEYEKAVQQSVYEQFCVIHEGKLRVIFRHDLKILSWEFCASHHDEYFLRRLIAPEVNRLMCVTQQYQGMLNEGTPMDKVPVEMLQASCDMFAEAGNQFTRSLESPTVHELGFSKRYVRCLQIAEVFNIMQDLMTFSHDQKLGPIASLHAYHHKGTVTEPNGSIKPEKGQETSQKGSTQSVLTNGNHLAGRNMGLDSHFNDTGTTGDGFSNSGDGDKELLVAHYYQKILSESLFNPRATSLKPDQSCLVDAAGLKAVSSSFLTSSPGLIHDSRLTGLASPESSEASKNIQQHIIDKFLQNAFGKQKERTLPQTTENILSGLPTTSRGTNLLSNGAVPGNSTTAALGQVYLFDNVRGNAESSGVTSNTDSHKVAGSNIKIKQETDTPEFRGNEVFWDSHGQFSKHDV